MNAEMYTAFVVTALAIGYWAWTLVFSGVFVWGRKGLEAIQANSKEAFDAYNDRIEIGMESHGDKRMRRWFYWKHRVVKFFRDMLRCPFCTAFHLTEIAQIGYWLFNDRMLNMVPAMGHLGVVATWFALAAAGGGVGFAIGYITGHTWHNSNDEIKLRFFMNHGRNMSEEEENILNA